MPRTVPPGLARAAAGIPALTLAFITAPGPLPAVAATGVPAVLETPAVETSGDAADDMAIWAHPTDPALSLVIGTDRDAALEVYDMRGRRLQRLDRTNPNNVDIRPMELGGRTVTLVGGADWDDGDFAFWVLDPETRRLTEVTAGDGDVGTKASGFCMYRSRDTGTVYAFGVTTGGEVVQAELVDEGGRVGVDVVRRWDVGGHSEGCVADDERGLFYVSEEEEAIWRYGAEPGDSTSDRRAVDRDGGNVEADIEGLALVTLPGGAGYLIASSQGDDTFAVYQREGDNDFVRSFAVVGSAGSDGCSHTDGIDALAANLGPDFPHGMFSCQDNDNDRPGHGNQNFKYVPLEDVVDLGVG